MKLAPFRLDACKASASAGLRANPTLSARLARYNAAMARAGTLDAMEGMNAGCGKSIAIDRAPHLREPLDTVGSIVETDIMARRHSIAAIWSNQAFTALRAKLSLNFGALTDLGWLHDRFGQLGGNIADRGNHARVDRIWCIVKPREV